MKWTRFPGAIGAFVAEMDFGTAPAISRALESAIANYQFGYLSPQLLEAFAQSFTNFAFRKYDWTLQPSQVRPIPDVLAGIEAIIRFLLPPDAVIILPTPAYMPFRPLFRDLGCSVIEVPMVQSPFGQYVNDLVGISAGFAAASAQGKTGCLILVNPHNPTGRVLTEAELLAICDTVSKYDGRVIADEIHAPLVYPGFRHIPYASLNSVAAAHSFTLVSASKAWNLAGLKAAQLVLTNDADLRIWERRGQWTEHMTATIGVIASIAAYDNGAEWLSELLDYLAANRKFLTEFLAARLPSVRYYPPEGTYLTWLDFRDHKFPQVSEYLEAERAIRMNDVDSERYQTDLAASERSVSPAAYLLQHAGVALTDGRQCGRSGLGFARLNIATPRPILEQTLNQIADALADLEA